MAAACMGVLTERDCRQWNVHVEEPAPACVLAESATDGRALSGRESIGQHWITLDDSMANAPSAEAMAQVAPR